MTQLKLRLIIALALFSKGSLAALLCTPTVTSVAFGSYNPFNPSAKNTVGTLSIYCQGGPKAVFDIKLSLGTIPTNSTRKMQNTIADLDYNLYLDSALTQVFGDGTNGTVFISDIMDIPNDKTGRTFTYSLYGRVPPQQNRPAGAYIDTLTATVNYKNN